MGTTGKNFRVLLGNGLSWKALRDLAGQKLGVWKKTHLSLNSYFRAAQLYILGQVTSLCFGFWICEVGLRLSYLRMWGLPEIMPAQHHTWLRAHANMLLALERASHHSRDSSRGWTLVSPRYWWCVRGLGKNDFYTSFKFKTSMSFWNKETQL